MLRQRARRKSSKPRLKRNPPKLVPKLAQIKRTRRPVTPPTQRAMSEERREQAQYLD